MHADWVYALGIVALVIIGSIAARWKGGRRRHLRITVVIERDYEGPDKNPPPV